MNTYRKSLVFIGDIICFIGSFFLFIAGAFPKHEFLTQSRAHALPLGILVIIWMGIFFIFNFYDVQKSKPDMLFLRNFLIAGLIMLGVGFAFFYIDPVTSVSPKTNLVIFEGISLALILAWRRFFYLTTSSVFHTRFAIVCADERHQFLVNELLKNPHLGFLHMGTYPTLGDFMSQRSDIDLLILHKTALEETEVLEKVLASNIEVIDLAEAYERILYKIPVHFIDSQWVIRSIRKQGTWLYNILSRIISIVFAVLVLIVTLPISLAIAIAIKLEDGGPLIYRNDRVGLNGKTFFLYKFRSMIINAEKDGAVWATVKDSRTTRVGTITRKLHVDEIPQMLNLLKGDLALVGPRPERPEFVANLEKEIPYYFMRHTIKPGFTGWAQIKFRYARTVLDSEEKFEYDLFYLKNRNIFLDVGIILKTAQIVFTHAEK